MNSSINRRRFGHVSRLWISVLTASWFLLYPAKPSAAESDSRVTSESSSASLNTQVGTEEARVVFQADIKGTSASKDLRVYGLTIQQTVQIEPAAARHTATILAKSIHGSLEEVIVKLGGTGTIHQVSGSQLEDWSLRQESSGSRSLVVRLKKSKPALASTTLEIVAEAPLGPSTNAVASLTFTHENPALSSGFVRLDLPTDGDVELPGAVGILPVDTSWLPETVRAGLTNSMRRSLVFRFLGTFYSLPLLVRPLDPEANRVVLKDVRLDGQLSDTEAVFTVTATAQVRNPKGGSLLLLSGDVALTEALSTPDWQITFEEGRFQAHFEKAGNYPVQMRFQSRTRLTNGWNQLSFRMAPGALMPVVLRGLKPDTQFKFHGAARPERAGELFQSFLPTDGQVDLVWKESRAETEGVLFFTTTQLSQIAVRPGILRQTTLLGFQVMQGDLTQAQIRLRGSGELTRVQGPDVLAWNVEVIPGSTDRRLQVQFNQPQRQKATLILQSQAALDEFPVRTDVLQWIPEGTTRTDNHYRIINEGAVRLEVLQSMGLSQISPEQFPMTPEAQPWFSKPGSQVFVYRYTGGAFALQLLADAIQPELAVSQVSTYHLGEADLRIDSELDLEVREAPIRELSLQIPSGFAIAKLEGSGITDHFLSQTPGQTNQQLKLVFIKPVLGRQLVQLRLERNSPLGGTNWILPPVELEGAKSSRGHVGIAADDGWRLTPLLTRNLTEIATALFPRKSSGLQSAYRISDPTWQATLSVERMPQSIQVDALHLFSVGEGIAYGSSLLNYVISGAPIAAFQIALTNEYFNVEFTGKDVRNWQQTATGYIVQLHTPVSGPYTLLATYERPFRTQGERIRFLGAIPIDIQSEQGVTVVVSTYPFQLQPTAVSQKLLRLEPGEIPAEYRLLFDAPVLAAFRYGSRPFDLELNLLPYTPNPTLAQIVDRASLLSRVSRDGQVVTDARYFVKSRGAQHLQITLPPDAELWSASVQSNSVVPVAAGASNLIPLSSKVDFNGVQEVHLKVASRSGNAQRLQLSTPAIAVPSLLTDWQIEPEPSHQIRWHGGSVSLANPATDSSGFTSLRRFWQSAKPMQSWGSLSLLFLLLLVATGVVRLATSGGVRRFGPRHLLGGCIAVAAITLALLAGWRLVEDLANVPRSSGSAGLQFISAIQAANTPLTAQISTDPLEAPLRTKILSFWPGWLGLVVWIYARVSLRSNQRPLAYTTGWLLLFWATLRSDNGAPPFMVLGLCFIAIRIVVPCLKQWWQVATGPDSTPTGPVLSGATTRLGWMLLAAQILGSLDQAQAQTQPADPTRIPKTETIQRTQLGVSKSILADTVTHVIRVEKEHAFGQATLRWQAIAGQSLPLLKAPGVLTRVVFPNEFARLIQSESNQSIVHSLLAQRSGEIVVTLEYQVGLLAREGALGFILPTSPGLINTLALTLVGVEADVMADKAISIKLSNLNGSAATTASMVLAPVDNIWIGWKPRARDTRRERSVFYADLQHLYLPNSGVIEGQHRIQIRPSQGEVTELFLSVPNGMTISEVTSPSVQLWRLDPQTQQLRIQLQPPQSRPFNLSIRSQTTSTPLPYEHEIGLLNVIGAAGQAGLLGVATGNDVQLEEAQGSLFSAIHLEDFPLGQFEDSRKKVPGFVLRRAFRHVTGDGRLKLKASRMTPDVRVETEQTMSLSEDRSVLAANLSIAIHRAGIFKVSFPMPTGFDVDSISGSAISHWTESKIETNRIITVHFKTQTEGTHSMAITLAGPGVRQTTNWLAPKLLLREASKQTGRLLIAPEQGLRLQIQSRDGLTQLDPQQSGVRQKGVLQFRLLNSDWVLLLQLERIDAWTQVTSLQQVEIEESRVQTVANLQFEIENAGVKGFRIRLPADAESVRFRGDQVVDSVPTPAPSATGYRDWEIKLDRRVQGRYRLQVQFTQPMAPNATNFQITGIQALDVNLQRGFLTTHSGNRQQARIINPPGALQVSEAQSIPKDLLQDLPPRSSGITFRLVEPTFQASVEIVRHEIARTLPSRVLKLTLTSVLSEEGTALTHAHLVLIPGENQLLRLNLPTNAVFWFAFVDNHSVRPWRDNDRLLIPLERTARLSKPVTVEWLYDSRAGSSASRNLDLSLIGPRLDLPLENILWHVFLDPKWVLNNSSGQLQLQEHSVRTVPVELSLDAYARLSTANQQQQSRHAEELLARGNSLLQSGNPDLARRAFQDAFGLSQHDAAFNEDARVQLHNLKTQQALVGLNFRQARAAGETPSLAPAQHVLRDGTTTSYTQKEAQQLIERNTAEESAVQTRLVERLIRQQEAVVANPIGIHPTVPELGRRYTFTRSLQVTTNTPLQIGLSVRRPKTDPIASTWMIWIGIGIGGGITVALRRLLELPAAAPTTTAT